MSGKISLMVDAFELLKVQHLIFLNRDPCEYSSDFCLFNPKLEIVVSGGTWKIVIKDSVSITYRIFKTADFRS